MVTILSEPDIPFTEKAKLAEEILINFSNIRTKTGIISFALCLVIILSFFYLNNKASFYILLEKLLKAIKQEKVSKRLARLIVRKFQRQNIPVDPAILEAIDKTIEY